MIYKARVTSYLDSGFYLLYLFIYFLENDLQSKGNFLNKVVFTLI